MVDNDIIVAPATAMGGAIAVIRMSGEGAVECCDKVFAGRSRLADVAPYTVHYGRIVGFIESFMLKACYVYYFCQIVHSLSIPSKRVLVNIAKLYNLITFV